MITKQQVESVVFNSIKPPTFQEFGLGLMSQKERLLLTTLKVIKSIRTNGDVYDIIVNQDDYLLYYELRHQVAQGRKYARLNGINELAAGNHF